MVLFDSLVKPTISIPAGASNIHRIRDEHVADAPTFADILPELREILAGRTVVVYNLDYDHRLMIQSAAAHSLGTGFSGHDISWHCAMETYAAFYGDWNDHHESYRWQKLSEAARQCGLDIPADLHRAYADADLTRQIVMCMAGAGS